MAFFASRVLAPIPNFWMKHLSRPGLLTLILPSSSQAGGFSQQIDALCAKNALVEKGLFPEVVMHYPIMRSHHEVDAVTSPIICLVYSMNPTICFSVEFVFLPAHLYWFTSLLVSRFYLTFWNLRMANHFASLALWIPISLSSFTTNHQVEYILNSAQILSHLF